MTADALDEASANEARERDSVVALERCRAELRTRLAVEREAQRGTGPAHCIECDIEIPLERRHAVPGCLRCTRCENERPRSFRRT